MAKSNEPSDAQILARLRRRKSGLTAADLGTTAARLRRLDGVVEVGRVHTGRAGRPAVLFAAQEQVEAAGQGVTTDPSALSRTGQLSDSSRLDEDSVAPEV